MTRLPIGTRLNNYGVRVVVVAHDDGAHIAYTEGRVDSARVYIEGDEIDLWTVVPSDADREVEALRRQVAELTALGVSLHKAEDQGRREERAAIVAWLRAGGRATSEYYADCVEQGDHEVSR